MPPWAAKGRATKIVDGWPAAPRRRGSEPFGEYEGSLGHGLSAQPSELLLGSHRSDVPEPAAAAIRSGADPDLGLAPSAAHGCTNGVPACQRALAGKPSPPQLLAWIGLVPVGVTHGQG